VHSFVVSIDEILGRVISSMRRIGQVSVCTSGGTLTHRCEAMAANLTMDFPTKEAQP